MLDMGFEHQIRSLVEDSDMPACGVRRTAMFSATFPKEIKELASSFMVNYVWIAVGRVGSTINNIEQRIMKAPEDVWKKLSLLYKVVNPDQRTLVFVRTKKTAGLIAREMRKRWASSSEIHGGRTQEQREYALKNFREGRIKVLVATNVAARGLDIAGVEHVVNFDLATTIGDFADYIHRIGRTGRAGHKGVATSFYVPGYEKDVGCAKIASELLKVLDESKQVVPKWFLELSDVPERARRNHLMKIDNRKSSKRPLSPGDDDGEKPRKKKKKSKKSSKRSLSPGDDDGEKPRKKKKKSKKSTKCVEAISEKTRKKSKKSKKSTKGVEANLEKKSKKSSSGIIYGEQLQGASNGHTLSNGKTSVASEAKRTESVSDSDGALPPGVDNDERRCKRKDKSKKSSKGVKVKLGKKGRKLLAELKKSKKSSKVVEVKSGKKRKKGLVKLTVKQSQRTRKKNGHAITNGKTVGALKKAKLSISKSDSEDSDSSDSEDNDSSDSGGDAAKDLKTAGVKPGKKSEDSDSSDSSE